MLKGGLVMKTVALVVFLTLNSVAQAIGIGAFGQVQFPQFEGMDAESHVVPMVGLAVVTENAGPRLEVKAASTLSNQVFHAASQDETEMVDGVPVVRSTKPQVATSSFSSVSLGVRLPISKQWNYGLALGRGFYSVWFTPSNEKFDGQGWTYDVSISGKVLKVVAVSAGYNWAKATYLLDGKGNNLIGSLNYEGAYASLGLSF